MSAHSPDLTQAYIESGTPLLREVYIQLPEEMDTTPDHVLKVVKHLDLYRNLVYNGTSLTLISTKVDWNDESTRRYLPFIQARRW